MNGAKIRLSEEEQELISNPGWILTKNRILERITLFLSQLQTEQEKSLLSSGIRLPEEVMAHTPKISKGENYLGLPYRMLDYPRSFSSRDHFAIRCFFWWGHYFSTTLHLSGKWPVICLPGLQKTIPALLEKGALIAGGDDPWVHNLEDGSWFSLASAEGQSVLGISGKRDFLKVAIRYKPENRDILSSRLLDDFLLLAKAAEGD